MAGLLPKKRLEPIGIEDPASLEVSNGQVLQKITKGIDVQYESGISTIRISGTPVQKRKQIFENPQSQKEAKESTLNRLETKVANRPQSEMTKIRSDKGDVENEDNASPIISASVEILSDITDDVFTDEGTAAKDINGNESNDNLNGDNNNTLQRKSSKKVSFLETVAVNKNNSTTLSGSDMEDEKDSDIAISPSAQIPAHTDAIETLPQVFKEEVEVIYTNASQHEVAKPLPVSTSNGYATPIVDEYELRQLSRKLSSREMNGPSKLPVAALSKNSVNVKDRKSTVKDRKSNLKDKQPNVKSRDTDKKVKGSGKYKKKLKSNRMCMWLAVVVIIMAVAGLMVLGILYAISTTGQSVEEVKSILTSKLFLTESNAVFTGAMMSPRSDTGLVYTLLDSGDRMTWRKPGESFRLSWHRGITLQIHSLPVVGGELSTFHMGDLVDEFGSQYSELLISDYWYAAQVEGKESYCLLSLYYPGFGNTTWDEADLNSLLTMYPEHSSLIQTYS